MLPDPAFHFPLRFLKQVAIERLKTNKGLNTFLLFAAKRDTLISCYIIFNSLKYAAVFCSVFLVNDILILFYFI